MQAVNIQNTPGAINLIAVNSARVIDFLDQSHAEFAEMPIKNGELTQQEGIFAQAYAATGDSKYAASLAGYRHPAVAACKALQRPGVQEAIRNEQVARINCDLLPLAVKAIERVLTDAKTPAGAVVQAAKLVFDRTLGAQEDGRRKDPSEMTGDELQQAIEQLRREAAERARPILEAEPVKQDVMG